jgi:glycosyltransferase involved in cell wall biosynthesis
VVAYLTGEYPKVSHTFIQREVAALRRQSLEILTCAIRETPPAELTGPEEREAAATTFYALAAAKRPWRLVADHAGALLRAPRRYLGALALALRTSPSGAKALVWQLFYFAEAGVLAGRLRRAGATHIHNHFADSSCTVAMLAAAMTGLPFSFTMHGPTEFFAVERWRLDQKIARAAFVACISHFCRSQLMMLSDPAHWGKLRIVHCGVEPARYGAGAGRDGTGRIVFVGRLAAVKGALVLLEAFRAVCAAHPQATLTLIGDGPLRADLEARAAALGLGDAIAFTGYLSQQAVAERLADSDVFVLPSFAEGVPVVLMEAMASGLPVATTRIAGIPELVEHDVSGLLVLPGDADALAAALSRLLAEPARRARMGAAGRAKVAAEFDIEAESAWLATLFRGYAEGRPPEGLRPAERETPGPA